MICETIVDGLYKLTREKPNEPWGKYAKQCGESRDCTATHFEGSVESASTCYLSFVKEIRPHDWRRLVI